MWRRSGAPETRKNFECFEFNRRVDEKQSSLRRRPSGVVVTGYTPVRRLKNWEGGDEDEHRIVDLSALSTNVL
ncbi:hypothetical protein U1Q18_048879 [Sarracenia purpurea var. burkii]